MYSMTQNYFKNTAGVLLVYDVTNRRSFENLEKWLGNIDENVSPKVKKILIANKIDLDFEREISRKEGEAFANNKNITYIETSAKTSFGVYELFNKMTHEVYLDVLQNKIRPDTDGI